MENRRNSDAKNDVKSLITKIKYIQITEALKNPSEMDADLVTECADFVLEEENREFDLSPAEIKRRVEKIPFKNVKPQSVRYKKRRVLKSVLIATVIMSLLVVTCMAVKPTRNFITKVTDDGTFFKFSITDNNDYLYANYNFIPEGYSLVSAEKFKSAHEIEYKKNDLSIFISSCNNKNNVFVNSENAIESGEIEVGKTVGYYCINKDMTFLVWSTGKYNHTISADNCEDITLDTLVEIALSREAIQ